MEDDAKFTVSGYSSGGFMAANMAIWNQGVDIEGVAIISGAGPCALSNFDMWCGDYWSKSKWNTNFLDNFNVYISGGNFDYVMMPYL